MVCFGAFDERLHATLATDRFDAIDSAALPCQRKSRCLEVGDEHFNFLTFAVFTHRITIYPHVTGGNTPGDSSLERWQATQERTDLDDSVAAYAQVVVPVNDIDVGGRDRLDMGDLAGLTASIRAVGLLHPVVITADWQLVAGDRRLAAVRELGWREVPVTIVDLATAADVFRAEIDENTCRKELTPDEASRVRQRRARVLAEDAKRRQGSRTDLQPAPNLGGRDSGCDQRTAKVAAIGTGYSGSTLDKVDGIREVAERGVIRLDGREVPAPEPVREAARTALRELQQPGAPVDRLHRSVAEAIERHVEPDRQTQRARQLKAWRDALHGARAFREFDMTMLPELLTEQDWDGAAVIVDDIAEQAQRFREKRPSQLRVVSEGRA